MNAANTLDGQVVCINGAGRSPGPLLVETFLRAGARVAACDVSPVLLDPLVASGQAAGGEVRAYVGEMARGMPARALVDEVLADFDRIDVLVNNPRVAPNTPITRMDEWDFQHTLEVNLSGPFLVTHLVSRMMIEQGGGVILNVVAADEPDLYAPGRSAYAASQAGLLALTRTTARELIAYNIRTYAICLDGAALEPALQPKHRLHGSIEKSLAELALYLCSPAAAGLAGQVFRVEGLHPTPPPE
jgi:NAD(P)-dependent dehydrogenase (short-subunit alcohol dehydrogenase family)